MRFGGDPAYCDRVEKRAPILLVLACVRPRELADRLIEFGAVADIARQRHRIAGSRMSPRQAESLTLRFGYNANWLPGPVRHSRTV